MSSKLRPNEFRSPIAIRNASSSMAFRLRQWVSVERVSSASSDAIEPILENLFDHFGVPVEYKTDNGSPFQSQRFAAFALEKGFKHRKVTPEWPRANGGAESFMKKLGKVVRIAKMTNLDKYVLIKDIARLRIQQQK